MFAHCILFICIAYHSFIEIEAKNFNPQRPNSLSVNRNIIEGLEKGDELFNAVTRNDWTLLSGHLTDWSLAFLKSLVVVCTESGGVRGSNLQRMLVREYLGVLNKQVPGFATVLEELDWRNTKVDFNFTSYELSISELQKIVQRISETTSEEDRKREVLLFIDKFEKQYNNSAEQLVNDFYILVQEVISGTQSHLSQTQSFLGGALKLILNGIHMEETYAVFAGQIDLHSYTKWTNKLNVIQNLLLHTVAIIKEKWFSQTILDILQFDYKNMKQLHPNGTGGLSTNVYGSRLSSILTTKYNWREWIIVVTPKHENLESLQCIMYCRQDSFASFNHIELTMNVVVSSVEKSKIVLNNTAIRKATEQLPKYLNTLHKSMDLMVSLRNQLRLYKQSDFCKGTHLLGVFEEKKQSNSETHKEDFFLHSSSERNTFNTVYQLVTGFFRNKLVNFKIVAFG